MVMGDKCNSKSKGIYVVLSPKVHSNKGKVTRVRDGSGFNVQYVKASLTQ